MRHLRWTYNRQRVYFEGPFGGADSFDPTPPNCGRRRKSKASDPDPFALILRKKWTMAICRPQVLQNHFVCDRPIALVPR